MIHDFFLAIGFFTRIPVPSHPNFSELALKRSAVYFPLVGILVGSIIGGVYLIANTFWSPTIAVLLALTAGFLVTGGFHEDGWADTFDGLGGAFDVKRKLEIMTDSRLGTYGSLALWSLLTLKAAALITLIPAAGFITWLVIHSLSRWSAMSAMVWLDYVRVEPSKAKPVVHNLSFLRWLMALAFVAPALFFIPWQTAVLLFLTSACSTLVWQLVVKKQIGGYTGDTLGAGQQFNELTLILAWLMLL
jgi:adenosylcobinamide-GDP ribazoletransferase